jgi:transposase
MNADRLVPNEFARNPELRKLPTLALFRMGYSTFEIAAFKGKSEATVYKWLHEAREAERQQISELRTAK